MKSSLANPIGFFEYIIDENNIYQNIEALIYYYDFLSYSIELPNAIKYIDQDENGTFRNNETTVEYILLPQIRQEFENSKQLLLSVFLHNNSDYNKNFIIYLFNSIQSLIRNRTSIINKYPFFMMPLRGLVKFINDRLLLPNTEPFLLNEDGVEFLTIGNGSEYYSKSNLEIVKEVFSYMSGKNEKQEQILKKEEFDLLIEYTIHLIEQESIPKITKQLKPKVQQALILFSYWVLHDKIYTTTRIRTYFYNFIKLVFENFSESELTSIKKQFGSKSRVTSMHFLPKVIKQYFE